MRLTCMTLAVSRTSCDTGWCSCTSAQRQHGATRNMLRQRRCKAATTLISFPRPTLHPTFQPRTQRHKGAGLGSSTSAQPPLLLCARLSLSWSWAGAIATVSHKTSRRGSVCMGWTIRCLPSSPTTDPVGEVVGLRPLAALAHQHTVVGAQAREHEAWTVERTA